MYGTIILINGHPGVGKLTVARELVKILPDAKVFDNHLLIDAVAALYERDHPAYYPLRKALRSAIFNSLSSHERTGSPIYIFTENAATINKVGSAVLSEYLAFACASSFRLIHVILSCSPSENKRRLIAPDRSFKTKLVDTDVLMLLRESEMVEPMGEVEGLTGEIEIETSDLVPAETAAAILKGFSDLMCK
ncbi:MAG: hypothetical protein TREMPRED_003349 [Tremellales sp. Tagirdzhanova-0007]|nr:MAG: hypothetical protein TREMPRED_003349 [Tremellales sp. Tagirdzhanova-0007]